MPRKPDERIEQAKELYLKGQKLIEIARQLDLPEGTVRRWKSTHKWDSERSEKYKGAQPGNKNASGHGAPKQNSNAEKHGLFRKYLPKETFSIIDEMPSDPLDVLWDQIQIAYAAIIRAQQIMYVKDSKDMSTTKIQEKNGDTVFEEHWEVQQAWDKQANFLKSQARAQGELRSMIKQYDELVHKNWKLATKEQKTRIAVLKLQAKILQSKANDGGDACVADDGFLDALNGTAAEDWADEDTADI